jgi:hypothetical protein
MEGRFCNNDIGNPAGVMNTPQAENMKIKISLALLFFFLAACAPVVTPALTDTLVPNTVPSTFTPATTIVYPTPSPYPTKPPLPILTPDAIQVEGWKEYQTELAKSLFVYNPAFPQWDYGPAVSKDAICEWDILGRPGQEVYLWAACITADGLYLRRNPTVIYLEPDGSIREVKVASVKIDRPEPYLIYDLHLIPMNIQEKLCLYYFDGYMPQCHEVNPAFIFPLDYWQSRASVLLTHLKYRIGYPEELPLVVLSAMTTVTPVP